MVLVATRGRTSSATQNTGVRCSGRMGRDCRYRAYRTNKTRHSGGRTFVVDARSCGGRRGGSVANWAFAGGLRRFVRYGYGVCRRISIMGYVGIRRSADDRPISTRHEDAQGMERLGAGAVHDGVMPSDSRRFRYRPFLQNRDQICWQFFVVCAWGHGSLHRRAQNDSLDQTYRY